MIYIISFHELFYEMETEKYVTVIPVEYPRPSRLYPHPPHQYSDHTEDIPSDSVTCFSQTSNYVNEHQSIAVKHREYVPNDQEPNCPNDCNETRYEFQTNSDKQPLSICVYLMNNIVLHLELEDGNNTTVTELIQFVIELEDLLLPESAKNVFTIWMSSGLLEVQLKPHHKLLLVRSKWSTLLSRFAHATLSRQIRDEPILSFQRNVFYSLSDEEKLMDVKVLELLYEEAKYNILEGRYPCEISQYIMLGGIQARLELGPYNPQVHTNRFFRSQKNKFLPVHIRHDAIMSWFRSRIKNSPEVRLLEHYKRIPNSASDRKLQRRYLEVCWSLPFYGCAFFQGQIEEPVRGLTSLLMHQDMPVLVGINEHGLYLIDNIQAKLLLGLKYEDFSWELGKPHKSNPDCLPCIFIQFAVIENGARVSKIMQIFSKQSDMVDALITAFVDQRKERLRSNPTDEMDGPRSDDAQMCKLPNKLSKLTLATFDDEGHCIGQTGSLQFIN
ncbi:FERM domain-containing protein 8 isoform X2 [Planococcus citri]|uniref:FERM domain-containing protein 8 isoform X2 n=1 Tax=Planococcus citri TaxID=170843 RepID=UPI0031FA2B4A